MNAEVEPEADIVIMYLVPDGTKEHFTVPLTHEAALRDADALEREGNNVLGLITIEHMKERQAAARTVEKGDLSMNGAHLYHFLRSTTQSFQKLYPGVSGETALKAMSLLCATALKGDLDLQSALLDEIHNPPTPGEPDWRMSMRIAIQERGHKASDPDPFTSQGRVSEGGW